jgi:hypothetical protein
LQGDLRLPLDCRIHDVARVAEEMAEQERRRLESGAIKDVHLYSQRQDEIQYPDENRLRLEVSHPRSLDTVAAEKRDLTVLGDPGSGKTEWCKQQAIEEARRLRHLVERMQPSDGMQLPVFLTFNQLAAALSHSPEILSTFYEEMLAGKTATNIPPRWAEMDNMSKLFIALVWAINEEGRLWQLYPAELPRRIMLVRLWSEWNRPAFENANGPLVCLDAWDEVRETQQRKLLKDALPLLRQRLAFTGGRLRISSRLTEYDGALGEPGNTVDLLPLPRQRCHQFLAAFFASAPEVSHHVIGQLEPNHPLAGLVENPLMLSLYAIIVADAVQKGRSIEDLPTRRVEVLGQVLQTLLGPEEDQRKGRPSTVNWPAIVQERKRILCEIAWEFWPGNLFDARQLNDFCAKQERSQDVADTIQSLTGENPLLVAHGKDYRFLHLTIQEYLVANYLAEAINHADWDSATVEWREGGTPRRLRVRELLDRKSWLQAWRHVVILLAGLLANPMPLLRFFGGENAGNNGLSFGAFFALLSRWARGAIVTRLNDAVPLLREVFPKVSNTDLLCHREGLAAFACAEIEPAWWKKDARHAAWLREFGKTLWERWTECHDAFAKIDMAWIRIPMGIVASIQRRLRSISIWMAVAGSPDGEQLRSGRGEMLVAAIDWLSAFAKDVPWPEVDPPELLDFAWSGPPDLVQAVFDLFTAAPEEFWHRIAPTELLDGYPWLALNLTKKAPKSFWAKADSAGAMAWVERALDSIDWKELLDAADVSFFEPMSREAFLGILHHADNRVRHFAIRLLKESPALWEKMEPADLFALLRKTEQENSEGEDREMDWAMASLLKHHSPPTFWSKVPNPPEALAELVRADQKNLEVVAYASLALSNDQNNEQRLIGRFDVVEALRLLREGSDLEWEVCVSAISESAWRDRPGYGWSRKAVLFEPSNPEFRALVSGLIREFNTSDERIQQRALQALAYVDFWMEGEEIDVAKFLKCLESPESVAAGSAVECLKGCPAAVWESISREMIWRLLRSKNTCMRMISRLIEAPSAAIDQISPQEMLVWCYGHGKWVRQDAEILFCRRFIPRLPLSEAIALLEHASPAVRHAALMAALAGRFASIEKGKEPIEVRKALLRRLDDENPNVRKTACALLRSGRYEHIERAWIDTAVSMWGFWELVELEEFLRWLNCDDEEFQKELLRRFHECWDQSDAEDMPPFDARALVQRGSKASDRVRRAIAGSLDDLATSLDDYRLYLRDSSQPTRKNAWWSLTRANAEIKEQIAWEDLKDGLRDRESVTRAALTLMNQRSGSIWRKLPLTAFLPLLRGHTRDVRIAAWRLVVHLASEHKLRILADEQTGHAQLIAFQKLAQLPPVESVGWIRGFVRTLRHAAASSTNGE